MANILYTTIQTNVHRASIIPPGTYVGKGKEEWVRVMICGCGERLEATDDERLVEEVSTHLKRVHPDHLVASLSCEQVRRVIVDRAYKLEYALVYEGDEPDEEFGLDPY